MMRHTSNLLSIALVVAFMGGLLLATPVLAQYGLDETAGAAKLLRSETPSQIAGRVIGSALSLVGVIFFVLMIYAGITWMTSRGNQEKSKKALDTIIAAVIGIIIVFGAYAITNFVFSSVGEQSAANTGSGTATTPSEEIVVNECVAQGGECLQSCGAGNETTDACPTIAGQPENVCCVTN